MAVLGVILGAGSLCVAIYAVFVSKGANGIAADALRETRRQTQLAEAEAAEREAQAAARAVMRAEITPLTFTSQGSHGNFRPMVRITNVGTKDSGPTTVRVYMVAGADLMAWDDEQTRQDRTRPIVDPDVTFFHPVTHAPLKSQYLERTVDNVTTTMPRELRFVMPMQIPTAAQGANRLPVRVVVDAANADERCEWTQNVSVSYGPDS